MPGLVIRSGQMAAFEQTSLRRWIRDYLVSCYPERTTAMGPPALEELVASAIRKAEGHGFQDGQDIRKYVHVAFLVGPGFESDPACAGWARRALEGDSEPAARAEALQQAALTHLETRGA